MAFVRWVFVKVHSQPQFLDHALPLVPAHLRQPRYHQKECVIGNLTDFIQEDGAILKAQYLFGAFLVIQPAKPYFRTVGETDIVIFLVVPVRDFRETKAHDLGEGIKEYSFLNLIEPKAKDGMT